MSAITEQFNSLPGFRFPAATLLNWRMQFFAPRDIAIAEQS